MGRYIRNHAIPSLENSLAYTVLCDRKRWMGDPSPTNLRTLLDGAAYRVYLGCKPIPEWRIWGPISHPEFDPMVLALTRYPTMSIRFDMAIEFLYFSTSDACDALMELMQNFVQTHEFDASLISPLGQSRPFETYLAEIARRPGMYFGDNDGWKLRCYLTGMSEGGDWLGLPRLPGLRKAIRAIENFSIAWSGSRFGAYRHFNATELLKHAGIEPTSDEEDLAWRKASMERFEQAQKERETSGECKQASTQ